MTRPLVMLRQGNGMHKKCQQWCHLKIGVSQIVYCIFILFYFYFCLETNRLLTSATARTSLPHASLDFLVVMATEGFFVQNPGYTAQNKLSYILQIGSSHPNSQTNLTFTSNFCWEIIPLLSLQTISSNCLLLL